MLQSTGSQRDTIEQLNSNTCAWLCPRHQGYSSEHDRVLGLLEFTLWRERRCVGAGKGEARREKRSSVSDVAITAEGRGGGS